MNIEFIKCGIEYVKEIHSLILQFYEITLTDHRSEKLKSTLSELLTHPKNGSVFLVRLEKEFVGYIILTYGFSIEYGGRDAFIDEFFIKQDFRKKDIGSQVIDYINKYARASGIKTLHLKVNEKYKEAEGFYKKKGFTVHKSRLMSLRLN